MERFLDWWRHIPEHIDPYIIEIGSFRIGYYGLMYILAFATVYMLVLYRLKNERYEYSRELIQDYFIWLVLGVVIGGRLGYALIYDLKYYLAHPLEVFLPFDFKNGFRYTGIAGMSYHGGLIGVITISIVYLRKHKIGFWRFADFFSPAVPLGYVFGRIGNFINGELYGRVTAVPWGMYFPLAPDGRLRHPSQLYEAFFEGIFLFTVLWSIRKKRYIDGVLFALYLIGYGVVRFFIEFVREPDLHLGFVLGPFSTGQLLCLVMVLCGGAVLAVRKKGVC